ncbi:MAG TPA: hypothetical protein VGY54_12985, partial [Polyangiaceae bacterium]|nr:hypothetical protein [Polyangiaceae bacterium]
MTRSAFSISMLAVVAALGCGGRASHANAGATSGGASSLGSANAGATSGGASSLGGANAGAASGGRSSPGGSDSGTACAHAYGASWGFASSTTGIGGAVASDLRGNVAYVVDQTGILSRDATGTMRWAQAFPVDGGAARTVSPIAPAADGSLFAGTVSAIAPAGDGGFFVVGETPSDAADTAFVSRLGSQGGISWTQVLSGLNGP